MDMSTVVARASMSTDPPGRRIVARRFRTVAEKLRIVQELIDSGYSGAEVARRHGVNANLIFTWRRLHERGLLAEHTRRVRKAPAAKWLAVQMDSDRSLPPPRPGHAYLEIELPGGVRVRGYGPVNGALLEQVLTLLQR